MHHPETGAWQEDASLHVIESAEKMMLASGGSMGAV
jgi:hypothetical protein